MVDSSAIPDQNTSPDWQLEDYIETFLDSLWAWNEDNLTSHYVQPQVDQLTDAVHAFTQLPAPLADIDQANDRELLIATQLAGGVRDRGMDKDGFKAVVQDIHDLLEAMKESVDGDAADRDRELKFRLMEAVISGLQGLMVF